jgi:hypothetical protein
MLGNFGASVERQSFDLLTVLVVRGISLAPLAVTEPPNADSHGDGPIGLLPGGVRVQLPCLFGRKMSAGGENS